MILKVTFCCLIVLSFLFDGTFCKIKDPPWPSCTIHESSDERLRGKSVVSVRCLVMFGQSVSLFQYENWVRNRTEHTALTVTCQPGGKVEAPWPMKVSRMFSLEINGCQIHNYSKVALSWPDEEMSKLPTELLDLSLRNSVLVLNPLKIYNVTMKLKQLPADLECGALSLHKYIVENTTVRFENVTWPDEGSDEHDFLVDTYSNSTAEQFATTTESHVSTAQDKEIAVSRRCQFSEMRWFQMSNINWYKDAYMMALYTYSSTFPKLTHMILSGNGAKTIPVQILQYKMYFPKLTHVDMKDNLLSEVSVPLCLGRPRIHFDLRHNKLTTLTKSDIEKFANRSYAYVDVRDNSLSCDCSTEMIRRLADPDTARRLNASGYRYLYHMPCPDGKTMLGKITYCSPFEGHTWSFIVSLVVPSVVLLILFVGFVKFRKELMLAVYTNCCPSCWGLSCCKKYDAFISYNSRDEHWVHNVLVPRLEKTKKATSTSHNEGTSEGARKFKLCLHHRDFIVGASIAETIVKSVENSRHTVMILSKNFLHSEWCLMEFRTAYHQSLRERRKHLIVVVLEEIPMNDIDADLKAHLNTSTYLSVSNKFFWSKLEYALSLSSENVECYGKHKTTLSA